MQPTLSPEKKWETSLGCATATETFHSFDEGTRTAFIATNSRPRPLAEAVSFINNKPIIEHHVSYLYFQIPLVTTMVETLVISVLEPMQSFRTLR